jgi:hypothetical protein
VRALELRRQLVAGPAVGVGEDDRERPPAQLLERQLAAVDQRQPPGGRDLADREPLAPDPLLRPRRRGRARRERRRRIAPAGQRQDRLGADREPAGRPPVLVDQVGGRRAGDLVERGDLVVLLQQQPQPDPVPLEEAAVLLPAAGRDQDRQRPVDRRADRQDRQRRRERLAERVGRVDEDQQQRAALPLRERRPAAVQVGQVEVLQDRAGRQARRGRLGRRLPGRLGRAGLLERLEPQDQPAVLADQLVDQPAEDEDRQPGQPEQQRQREEQRGRP